MEHQHSGWTLLTNHAHVLVCLTMDCDITDNGPGMDAETRENLFNLFYSSKQEKGTGLGLHIAKTTVQQHGGHIQVTSTPGQGSRFLIRLPRRPDPDLENRVMAPDGNQS